MSSILCSSFAMFGIILFFQASWAEGEGGGTAGTGGAVPALVAQ